MKLTRQEFEKIKETFTASPIGSIALVDKLLKHAEATIDKPLILFDNALDALIDQSGEVYVTGDYLRGIIRNTPSLQWPPPAKEPTDAEIKKMFQKVERAHRQHLRLGLSAQFLNTLLATSSEFETFDIKVENAVQAADGLMSKLGM